ncbi:hypothetical protein N7492_008659 [Penicillium capsulatum]|uniref:Uncharacterized protein n=1 Tax=Penicillium capsulatum TaxID=69766 RepID=A0A9W9HTX0_9EURO|nr:hypothetical protein N7492_008659 [Penicillium capsulatum]KAJ6106063.1 hypothetical protein N7512_009580 [Penicillium capsulatum]
MMGCCSSSSCVFHTICYNAADILQSRTLTETTRPFAIYCTEPEYPFCRTWVFESPHVTNFGCGPTSETINNVSDYAWWTEQGLATLHTQYLTTVGDKLVSEYAHSFSSVPTSIAMGASQALTPSSQSTRTTSTSEATAGASESTKSSTSSGAIAGGVVGGVAGGAAMVLGGIFLWRRRKQNELARTSPDTPGSGGDYQSVLGNHIGHSGMEMQSPMEVESNDPSHRYSEVPGTVTSDRAFEMHADPNAQVKAGFELDASSKDWTAELPADYHRPLN